MKSIKSKRGMGAALLLRRTIGSLERLHGAMVRTEGEGVGMAKNLSTFIAFAEALTHKRVFCGC